MDWSQTSFSVAVKRILYRPINHEKSIIFTSGATESNNLAIQGIARFYKEKGNRIITSAIEHKCVLEACNYLKNEGFDVVVLPVKSNGIVDIDYRLAALQDDRHRFMRLATEGIALTLIL